MTLPTSPRPRILAGTVRVFGAELLAVPTGLITAIFLVRRFGPSDYGLYSLAAVFITWLEWTITSIFSRAAIKFIGEADDPMAVGSAVVRWYAGASVTAAALVWLSATPISRLLGEPALASYLRLFALDVPIFNLAQAHRNILIGVGRFAERAWMGVARWLARMALIVLLVEMGWGIVGAIVGSIGASVIELLVGRWYIHPPLFRSSAVPAGTWLHYAIPLLLYSLTLGFYDRAGVFALTALGGTAEQAGFYSAAQNLTVMAGILAAALSPVLMAGLARALRDDDVGRARSLCRNAIRSVLLLAPFAGMTVGASGEAVGLVMGRAFLPAASLLAWLIGASLAVLMISVTTAELAAAGRPRLAFGLCATGLPIAAIGYWAAIPHLGPEGAAIATTLATFLAALATLVGVHRVWQIAPPWATAVRAAVVTAVAYGVGTLWATAGWWLVVKVGAIGLSAGLAFVVLGEFSPGEIRWLFARARVAAWLHDPARK